MGPLDALVSKTLVAYGLPRLFTSNAASLLVRESGGDTEEAIGTLASGTFDTASFNTFVGANDGFAVTAYDQTGGGNHVTQATAGLQPQVNLTGLNNLPAMDFTSASGHRLGLTGVANTIGTGDFEVWVLFQADDLSSFRILFSEPVAAISVYCSGSGSGKMAFWDNSFGLRSFDTVLSTGTVYLARVYRHSGVTYCDINGATEATSHAYTLSVGASLNLALASEGPASSVWPFDGKMTVALLFKDALTAPEAATLTTYLKTLGGIA